MTKRTLHGARRNERSLREQVRELEGELKHMADLYDSIAAAINAHNSGDNAALDAHVANIDQQLSDLKGTEAGDAQSIADIKAGLQKIADAVTPAAQTTQRPFGTTQAADPGTATTTTPA